MRRRPTLLGLALTLALVAAACGDDDDDTTAGGATPTAAAAATSATTAAAATTAASATPTTATGASAGTSASTAAGATTTTNRFAGLTKKPEPNPCPAIPGVTDTEIKVGVILILSGPQAPSFSGSLEGLQARIDKANETGELGKRKITLDVVDDTGDPTRNGEVSRQLIESDKVYAVIENSAAGTGGYQYLNQQGIPVTGWHIGHPEWNTYPNMFTFRQANDADPENYTTRDALVLQKFGASKIALIGGQNESSTRFINQIAASMTAVPGMSVVYKTTDVGPAQDDFTTVVQDIKNSGADGFYTGMDFLQNTKLSQQLDEAGVTNLEARIFPGGYDPRVLALPGIEGASFGLEFFPFESNPKPYADFDKYLKKDVTRNQISYIGWLNGETFVEGIKQAGVGCPTRENFINNLRLVHDWTAGGAFDAVDLATSFGHGFQCSYFVLVQGGKFVPQFGGEQVCGQPIRIKL
jgi:ABC-type branched-subunit amino acid transport system substrate-binding protein